MVAGHQFNLVLLILSCYVFVYSWAKRTTIAKNSFTKMNTGLSVMGTIGSNNTARHRLRCSAECGRDSKCIAYRFTSKNCVLLHDNLTESDGQELFSTRESPIYHKNGPCDSTPCQHGGKCDNIDAEDDVTCKCPSGYGGRFCQLNCSVDWCPPDGFTPDVLPVVYRNLDNGDNIQLMNGAGFAAGKLNQAIRLIGSNRQYIHLGDLSEACITRPETCGPEGAAFTVWFKMGDFLNGHRIISSKSTGKTGFTVHCDSYGWTIEYEMTFPNKFWVHNIGHVGNNRWFHVAVNYLPAESRTEVYIDKDSKYSNVIKDATGFSFSPGNGVVQIGRRNTNRDDNYSDMWADDLIFNTNLTQSDIALIYNMY